VNGRKRKRRHVQPGIFQITSPVEASKDRRVDRFAFHSTSASSDFDYAHINGNFNSAALCSITGGSTCFTELKDFSTDRVRVGVDLDGWLPFVTGGVGFGQVNAGQTPCTTTGFFNTYGGASSCAERWRAGWVAGAGVEKMIAPHWSAKIEHLHYDFGDTSSSAHAAQYYPTTIGGGNWVDVLVRGDMVRAGIDYHFDILNPN
jgi:outer membrane immunogenic protein